MGTDIPWQEISIGLTALICVAAGLRLHLLERRGRPAEHHGQPEGAQADAKVEASTQAQTASQPQLASIQTELLELRHTLTGMNNRIRNLQRRETALLDALSEDPGAVHPGADDLVAMARRGLNAAELMKVGSLSFAEAELLCRIHGQRSGQTRQTH